MDIMMDLLATALALPFVPMILLILFVVLVAMLVGAILKGIIRILFAPVRFVFCVAVVLLLIGLVAYSLFNNPILPNPERDEEGEAITLHNEEIALEEVAERFKGVFSDDLPLLAWRMDIVKGEDNVPEGMYQLNATPPVTVRIQYLPIGSLTVQYNQMTGKISIVEGLGEEKPDSAISSFLNLFGEKTPSGLIGES